MSDSLEMLGNYGCYVDTGSTISFQLGTNPTAGLKDPGFVNSNTVLFADYSWQSIGGFNVCSRGANNMKCEEVESDIKKNRLLPRLITKQVNMLYGLGPAIYIKSIKNGKLVKEWTDCPEITTWLESWKDRGLESDYKEVAKGNIKNYYYFRDYFVKWRMTLGNRIGEQLPVAGLELMENRRCRLATQKRDVVTELINYKDFTHIAVGRWSYGVSKYLFYPRLVLSDIRNIKWAAISHHREKSVSEFYGVNETHEGTKAYIKGSNDTANYINSFLRNSLAAKIHIIIPNAWAESKRAQITKICNENQERKRKNESLLTYNGIDIGTTYKESYFLMYLKQELRNISEYLSGADNQGKAYATLSFKTGSGEEERWKFEVLDLKYKEYIDALITYDKRADEVLLSSVGLDSSISSVSKDGVISKSGADVYYNYLIYLMSLTPDDEICSEPFNMAIRINFPELYKQGYRFGFYRETPSRQEEVTPNERLNKQQS